MFKFTEELMYDMPRIKSSTLKIILALKDKVGEKEVDTWIECSYDYLMEVTGISHKATIRKAIIEVANYGWIKGFKRGYYNKTTGEKHANSYLVSFVPNENRNLALYEEWYAKLANWGKGTVDEED